jgi:NAD(P)-dependent dehydrogenase (short-subunit alcohol dehydrogenase family)
MIAEAASIFGKIDIVCNNAGVDLVRTILTTSIEEFDEVMAVNVRGVFVVCREAIAAMRQTGGGAIINIASVAALVGLPRSAAYAASKGAVLSLTRQLAREFAADGIRVNAVCPGSTRTARLEEYLAQQEDRVAALKSVEGLNPMRRVGEPREIAAAVAFLASSEASFITGAEVVVDGGLVIQ